MKKSQNMWELEYLASSQWGMFTASQASSLGVGGTQVARMVGAGTVEPMRRGVYRYTVGEETSHPFAKAAWLAAYPAATAAQRLGARPIDAVVASHTAAALHGIGDLHEDPYTFIVGTRRQTTAGDLRFRTWPLDMNDITFVDGLPVTSMERTIADLVRERHDQSHVRQAATDAFAAGANAARLDELLGELGPGLSAAAGDLRGLADELAHAGNATAFVEAADELAGVVAGLIQDGATPRREDADRVASSIARLETSSRLEARPDVARAARDLASSLRTLLAAMTDADQGELDGVEGG